ncbi:DNA-binding protein WhiA [Helicovermis profundi]|uniref:Probable cell division protein WhiA n=1 Tax=Helicovermis profundi TaxID=3065157 RepID=A0AAU9EJI9_9FIRM|nr:DNA-binding protein WhiA [Clostridia bacterium S502]
MSFSSKTKNELCRIKSEDKCCMIAELSAIIRVSGSVSLKGKNQISLSILTENPAIARLVFTLFKKGLRKHTEILVKKSKVFKKINTYIINIDDAKDNLVTLGIISFEKGYFEIIHTIQDKIIDKECCKRAYIRGIFLGGGSVSDPEKGYHLEFVTHSKDFSEDFIKLINEEYDLDAKLIERKNTHIVYLKEGNQVVDLLNIIGAHKALLDFENVRIVKQMRNQVNRIVNCETANLNKTINAAFRQVKNIELIRDRRGLEVLPDSLRELAFIRLENRESNLSEIGNMLSKPLGKSGVNHRFKKIESIANEIREESVIKMEDKCKRV